MSALVLVHALHVLAAVVWCAGILGMSLFIWPMLLTRPAAESRAIYEALGPRFGPVMAISGIGLIALGGIRGVAYGPIRSLDALGTTYGMTFLAGLLGTIAITIFSGIARSKLEMRVWAGESYAPGAARYIHLTNALTVLALAGVLLCMVLMRFGL